MEFSIQKTLGIQHFLYIYFQLVLSSQIQMNEWIAFKSQEKIFSFGCYLGFSARVDSRC